MLTEFEFDSFRQSILDENLLINSFVDQLDRQATIKRNFMVKKNVFNIVGLLRNYFTETANKKLSDNEKIEFGKNHDIWVKNQDNDHSYQQKHSLNQVLLGQSRRNSHTFSSVLQSVSQGKFETMQPREKAE